MKIKNLHIKFFLIFIEAILINQLLMWGMFRLIIGINLERSAREYVQASGFTLKRLVEYTIQDNKTREISNNKVLQKRINELAQKYKAKIWIINNKKKTVCKSFLGESPKLPANFIKKNKPFSLPHKIHKGVPKFFYIHIKEEKKPNHTLIIYFKRTSDIPFETAFLLGMIVIGIFAAILLFPLYRYITRPLKALRETALLISSGEISQRVDIKSSDEVGELGKAFNKMAETLENMINSSRELSTNVSHELRSPLARIRVAEELLRMQLENENVKNFNVRHMDIIRKEVEEMDELIGQILTFSRQNMRLEMQHRTEFDLSELVDKLAGRFEYTIAAKRIILDIKTPTMPIFVNADKDAMRTAISNLIDNAIKFTSEGQRIQIALTAKNNHACFKITNPLNGQNFDIPEQLFKPFYRPEGDNSQGTGLGLAIVKKIIENHNGSITIQCEEDSFQISICL